MSEAAILDDFLEYDPLTGSLTWKWRAPVNAKTRSWNTRWAGKAALASLDSSTGYLTGGFQGKKLLAHRAAFAIAHGRWPDGDVDHLNGNRSDNRLTNLREATRLQNSRNRRMDSRCKTGTMGVTMRGTRWIARINVNGRGRYIGMFPTKEDAIAARKNAEIILGYHENHGSNFNV